MKVKNTVLVNLKGEPIKQAQPGGQEEKVLTVADALVDVALAPPPPGQPYAPQQTAERLRFAKSAVDTKVDDEFEVPTSLVQELDRDVARFYPVVVAGAIHELLK